jgi:hypothetical protein
MNRIVRTHVALRSAFRIPGTVASFINENTVVRTAAVMEHHLVRRTRRRIAVSRQKVLKLQDLLGDWCAESDWPDTCVRTVFVLRHFIIHLGGCYRPRSLHHWSRRHLLPAYRVFAKQIEPARVKQGEDLCLADPEVMQPLLMGCRDYWLRRRPGRARNAGSA